MKLLNQIQDIFYDIFGIILPGLFGIILLMPFLLYHRTFAFYFLTCGPLNLVYDISSISVSHNAFFLAGLLCFIAYLLGYIITNLLPFFTKVYHRAFTHTEPTHKTKRHLTFPFNALVAQIIHEKYGYVELIKKGVLDKLKDIPNSSAYTYYILDKKQSALLTSYADSNIRFGRANSNSTKYKNKQIFFTNIKNIMIFLCIDFICITLYFTIRDFALLVSSLIIVNKIRSSSFLVYCFLCSTEITYLIVIPFLKKVCFIVLIYICFLIFSYEEKHHEKLYEKELYLYLDYHLNSEKTRQ